MDWDRDDILSLTVLQHYERRSIRQRKRSNRFTAFLRCACREFKTCTMERKRAIIQRVFGRPISVVNIQVVKLVRKAWSLAGDLTKDAWKQRAEYLESQPRVGFVNRLPRTIPRDIGERDNMLRLCLQEESRNLQRDMRTFILRANIKPYNPEKQMAHAFPQSVSISGKIYKDLSLSPLMRRTILGHKLEYVKDYENQTVSRKYCPGYIHFSSYKRANSIFCIGDILFCSHVEEQKESDLYFHLTSIGVLTNGTGQQFNCWGWDETDTNVTFIYNDESSNDVPAKFTAFSRPKLVSTTRCTQVGQKKKFEISRNYSTETSFNHDGLKLTEYCPICFKIHLERCNLFNAVGARLVVRFRHNDVYIVTGSEYSGII